MKMVDNISMIYLLLQSKQDSTHEPGTIDQEEKAEAVTATVE